MSLFYKTNVNFTLGIKYSPVPGRFHPKMRAVTAFMKDAA